MSDELIKELQQIAQQKASEIGKIENYNNKTNLSCPFNGGRVNLNTINNKEDFVEILSSLMIQSDAFSRAASVLGVEVTFTLGGYTYEEWFHDIKNRCDAIDIRLKKKELKQINEQLDALLSPEAKKEAELEEIKKRLAK